MEAKKRRITRMYSFYVLFMLLLIGVFAILSSSVDEDGSGDQIPMNIFIRDLSCSGSVGDVVLQSWDHNDYSLPGVSLEISKLGHFKTGDNGVVTLFNVENGAYTVSASKRNYEGKSFEFTVSCPVRKITIAPEK